MADYPDFQLQTNIANQTLAQIINRPKYGAADSVEGNVAATANDETLICTVSGKGIIYGGRIQVPDVSAPETSRPRLYIDDELVVGPNFIGMLRYGMCRYGAHIWTLSKYDQTAEIYVAVLQPGITFEESATLKYNEAEGQTPTVYGIIVYALV